MYLSAVEPLTSAPSATTTRVVNEPMGDCAATAEQSLLEAARRAHVGSFAFTPICKSVREEANGSTTWLL